MPHKIFHSKNGFYVAGKRFSNQLATKDGVIKQKKNAHVSKPVPKYF